MWELEPIYSLTQAQKTLLSQSRMTKVYSGLSTVIHSQFAHLYNGYGWLIIRRLRIQTLQKPLFDFRIFHHLIQSRKKKLKYPRILSQVFFSLDIFHNAC